MALLMGTGNDELLQHCRTGAIRAVPGDTSDHVVTEVEPPIGLGFRSIPIELFHCLPIFSLFMIACTYLKCFCIMSFSFG